MGRYGENIRKRKDGRWEGRYKTFDEHKGKWVYCSVYGHAYKEVKEKLTKAKIGIPYQALKKQVQNMDNSQKNDGKTSITVLFSQAAMEWLGEIADKRKYSTYVKYNTVYQNHLAAVIGSCQISAAEAPKLKETVTAYLSEGTLSESLQKSIFCIANQVLDFANKNYGIGIPLLERLPVKPKKKMVGTLSKSEQARLLSGSYQRMDKFKLAVVLCLYTGLRLGELCALQWKDLDFEGMTLNVERTVQRVAVQGCQTKTILLETDPKRESSKRVIPVTAEILKLLLPFKGTQTYVFGGRKPFDPRTMQYRFQRMLKEEGIDSRNFHILRHTFATNCIESGMDVKALSEILGHSDVKITLNRYVHPTMGLKRKQLGMLTDFYGQICGQAA